MSEPSSIFSLPHVVTVLHMFSNLCRVSVKSVVKSGEVTPARLADKILSFVFELFKRVPLPMVDFLYGICQSMKAQWPLQ